MKRFLLVGLLVGTVSAQEVHDCGVDHDHEKTVPYVLVHADVSVYGDWVYDATETSEEGFNLKTHTHFDLEVSPVDHWFIRSKIKVEQSHSHEHGSHEEDDHDDEGRGGNRYFEDHVLIFEELQVVYAPGAWAFFAGKFNPDSGLDQHTVPGYYGYEIVEEYSILGRMGAGASYRFDTDHFGSHYVRASGFFRDTTFLNQTLINGSEEPDDQNDGGIANTEDFSSWAISLSGDRLLYTAIGDTIHDVDYVLAYAHQAAGYGADEDHTAEERIAVGGVYTATLTEDLQLRTVGEFKHIRNNGTHKGEDLSIYTAGVGTTYRGWELGGSYSLLDSNEDEDGHHIQASLGYVWPNGLGVHAGWKSVEEEGDEQKSVGLMVSYHMVY
jgi:hypothetical protein